MSVVNMLNNINMEFIQAFNPLYAVPIVAVILCAFIVYAFGFKSPVQPPSFEGIEEEKKYPKKRRAKETQKSNKLIQNGKANGSTVTKSTAVPTKKKETNEKNAASEKSSSTGEKSASSEKKASKKNKAQVEKKMPLEKKKESFSPDELNDDGWVQLISKKGRKNRKKDDVSASETSPKASPTPATLPSKAQEAKKSDASSRIEESPKKNAELQSSDVSAHSGKDQKQPTPATTEEKVAKEVKSVAAVEKPKLQDVILEVAKPVTNVEKQLPKETAAKDIKVLEESSKSKKKKKKNVETVHLENEPKGNVSNSISESPAVQANSENVAPNKTTTPKSDVIDSLPVSSKNQLPKETAAKDLKVSEASSKSKKKKKKNVETIRSENEPMGNISNTISESSAVQANSENVAPNKTATTKSDVIDSLPVSSSKVEADQPSDVKTSNVAFDELAGLYPEPKEQKKKKKVRREH